MRNADGGKGFIILFVPEQTYKHQSVTFARLAQLVERKPFKLVVQGSSPWVGIKRLGAGEACLAHNQKVGGSKPPAAIYKIF